jgi:hypothetical protein
VGKNRNGGACVDKKLLFGRRILEKYEAAEGIDLPSAAT